jgi:sporulation protein YlmC with PRC-barrel domain
MAKDKAKALTSAVVSSQDVEGVAVYDGQGRKVGTVDHLMIERASGRVLAVMISGSGFLGLGHTHFRVPWEALHYSTKRNAFETEGTPDPA